MSFLNRFRRQRASEPEPPAPAPPVVVPRAKGFVPPPPRDALQASGDPRVERLLKRIEALEDGIAFVEQSGDPASAFQQHLAVLNLALEAIEREIQEATPIPTRELPSLPATPVTDIAVQLEPAPRVTFKIGEYNYSFVEEIDWAERGTQIVRGDLHPEQVDTLALVPDDVPAALRDELSEHLERSMFAFATDLRDRTIEGLPIPEGVSLAELAVPSAACGDWEIWGGVSIRCQAHEARLRDLNTERTRLLSERAAAIEERQRQVEELPIQRRRLNQAIAELQAIESSR